VLDRPVGFLSYIILINHDEVFCPWLNTSSRLNPTSTRRSPSCSPNLEEGEAGRVTDVWALRGNWKDVWVVKQIVCSKAKKNCLLSPASKSKTVRAVQSVGVFSLKFSHSALLPKIQNVKIYADLSGGSSRLDTTILTVIISKVPHNLNYNSSKLTVNPI
jgi:hypothetical protein